MFLPHSRRSALPLSHREKPIFYLFWARNAIFHSLNMLGVAPGDSVLLPAFHCSTLVEPMRQYGVAVRFYNIRRDLTPDIEDIEKKIDRRTRALLAIHYFGFPQPIEKLSELCRSYNLRLIEDCAHVLTGHVNGMALGSWGDVAVYSWRKFLPLYDGGQLVVNNPSLPCVISLESPGGLLSLKVLKNLLEKLFDDSSLKAVQILAGALKKPSSLVREAMAVSGQTEQVLAVDNRSPDFDLSTVNIAMSWFSKYILKNLDALRIANTRRANYLCLEKMLRLVSGITPLHARLPQDVVPWVFPVVVPAHKNFHVTLRERGVEAFTWGGVIHPALPLDEFPDARFLYEHLVLLPIQQSLGPQELRRMTDIIRDVLHSPAQERTVQPTLL